jgi:hypothetical protein
VSLWVQEWKLFCIWMPLNEVQERLHAVLQTMDDDDDDDADTVICLKTCHQNCWLTSVPPLRASVTIFIFEDGRHTYKRR